MEMLLEGDPEIDVRLAKLREFHNHLWTWKHMDMAFENTGKSMHNTVLRGRLWIGDELDANSLDDESMFWRHGIHAVVSIGPRQNSYANFRSDEAQYHHIVCGDVPEARLCDHFDEATDFIHARLGEGKRVLVHCQAGISRSATICIAYLMRYHHMSWSAAYMVLKDARPLICPNMGFMTQLAAYEKSLH